MEYQIKYRRKIGRWPTVIPVGADSIRPQGPCKDRIAGRELSPAIAPSEPPPVQSPPCGYAAPPLCKGGFICNPHRADILFFRQFSQRRIMGHGKLWRCDPLQQRPVLLLPGL